MIQDVRADMRKIEIAAFELLEEGLGAWYSARLEERLGGSPSLERALASYETGRTLPAGLYTWAGHLFLLDGARELGLLPGPNGIQAVEMNGLAALGRARLKFREAHPPCPHCGTALFERLVLQCEVCGGKIERKAA